MQHLPHLGLEDARRIAAAARAKAVAEGWTVVIAIGDDGGNLILLERADGTQKASVAVAQEAAVVDMAQMAVAQLMYLLRSRLHPVRHSP